MSSCCACSPRRVSQTPAAASTASTAADASRPRRSGRRRGAGRAGSCSRGGRGRPASAATGPANACAMARPTVRCTSSVPPCGSGMSSSAGSAARRRPRWAEAAATSARARSTGSGSTSASGGMAAVSRSNSRSVKVCRCAAGCSRNTAPRCSRPAVSTRSAAATWAASRSVARKESVSAPNALAAAAARGSIRAPATAVVPALDTENLPASSPSSASSRRRSRHSASGDRHTLPEQTSSTRKAVRSPCRDDRGGVAGAAGLTWGPVSAAIGRSRSIGCASSSGRPTAGRRLALTGERRRAGPRGPRRKPATTRTWSGCRPRGRSTG